MPTFITESRPELRDTKGQCFLKAIKPKIVKTKNAALFFQYQVSCLIK
jgi:hypothetical protein